MARNCAVPNAHRARQWGLNGHDEDGKAIVKIDEVCSHFKQGRPNDEVLATVLDLPILHIHLGRRNFQFGR
jgi:hypothetical protein